MISDEDVKRLFQNGQSLLAKGLDHNKPLPTQFHRGVGLHVWEGQHPGGCDRHMSVFNEFNIIPKYCFTCYKVLIEPRTVVELFKLMVVFERLKLKKDNTRKCIVETREEVSGAYKGFVYCRGIEEGNEILNLIKKIMFNEVSEKIPITLKRGCSEYAIAYPEYAIDQGMEYKEDWQEYEVLADKNLVVNTQFSEKDSHNQLAYTLHDAHIMFAWLKYAATIGDLSYLKISGCPLPSFADLKRPDLFHPVENE